MIGAVMVAYWPPLFKFAVPGYSLWLVITGVKFKDGIETTKTDQIAA